MFNERIKGLPKIFCVALVAALFMCTSLSGQSLAEEGATNNVYDFEALAIEIKPLTLADCAGCHTSHFKWLRDNGAKHQGVTCTECHEIFHAYNPKRDNFAEIMPKCSSCHGAAHGSAEQVMQCLDCHTNPHQPLASIPAPSDLEDRCQFCHTYVADSLKNEVSMHTEQECSSCHSEKHGRIPVCSECHENHSPMAVLDTPDCKACHPVHTPLKISYPLTQSKEVCAGCHEEAFEMLQARTTKHSAFTCAKCHPQHGQLPACMDCHGTPHSPEIHAKYPLCYDCHGVAHDVARQ